MVAPLIQLKKGPKETYFAECPKCDNEITLENMFGDIDFITCSNCGFPMVVEIPEPLIQGDSNEAMKN